MNELLEQVDRLPSTYKTVENWIPEDDRDKKTRASPLLEIPDHQLRLRSCDKQFITNLGAKFGLVTFNFEQFTHAIPEQAKRKIKTYLKENNLQVGDLSILAPLESNKGYLQVKQEAEERKLEDPVVFRDIGQEDVEIIAAWGPDGKELDEFMNR